MSEIKAIRKKERRSFVPMDVKDIKKIETLSNKIKLKVEDEKTKKIKVELYCAVCQIYGHIISEECGASAICFDCGIKGHTRRDCKEDRSELKNEIKFEKVKEESSNSENDMKLESDSDDIDIRKDTITSFNMSKEYIEEDVEDMKNIKVEVYCIVCQIYGHIYSEACVGNAVCFACGVKGHVRRNCKEEKCELKHVKLEIKNEEKCVKLEIKKEEKCELKQVKLEIKNERAKYGREYVEEEINISEPKTEMNFECNSELAEEEVTSQVLPRRDPRLQGASDRDPRTQTSAERDSRHVADRDPRQVSSRDPRSNEPRTYSSTSERDSRYPSSSDRDSRYYSSSDRDREPRHRSPPGRDSRDSYDRSTSSSERGERDHRDHRSVDRQYSSADRRDRDHRSQTSSERDRYRDRDRGHYSSSGRDRTRHSPDRERRRHPSPDRHHSERDPRRLLTSSRITSPAGGRSPSYSPSPLQSPVPSPVPPPLFGRPLPPVAPVPPPSRDPRMAAASATSRPSSSVTAATMEKQLFDGLKEALEEAKQDQSGEDVEQKYDELLNNLLESMPDEEEQILNALDRAFVCVFGRTAKKRSRQTTGAVTPPTPQPPINLFQNLPNIASFSAPQPISGPFSEVASNSFRCGAGAYDAEQRKEIVREVLVDLIAPSDLARKYKISAHSIRDWVKKTGKTLPKQYKKSEWGPPTY